jgi:hypothetical protein
MCYNVGMMFPGKWRRFFRRLWRILRTSILLIGIVFFLGGAVVPLGGLPSRVRFFTRMIEFDFATWTLDAISAKVQAQSLGLTRFMPLESQSALVMEYLAQVQSVQELSLQISVMYADPTVADPEAASRDLRSDLEAGEARLANLAPLAEAVLQAQLMSVALESGLGFLGQVLPPSLYQVSELPLNLVVSPRNEIRRAMDVSLEPGLNLDAIDRLETSVFDTLDYAALVVPIGGLGSYPTMVMQTTNLVWLTEVIAHEWVHNYLTLRPLGINYATSPELRTINETTASLAGKELGRMILEKYYPEQLPPAPSKSGDPSPTPAPDPEAFDFRAEMRITRVETDRLLSLGKVAEAEAYLEARRQVFWENGFLIRKLNQAYFAFYGAYNDQPGGGAAGADPVGPAVVAYRARFSSLADFLWAISWVTSFDGLQARLGD